MNIKEFLFEIGFEVNVDAKFGRHLYATTSDSIKASIIPKKDEMWYINLIDLMEKNGYIGTSLFKSFNTRIIFLIGYLGDDINIDVGFEIIQENRDFNPQSYNTYLIKIEEFLDIFKSEIRNLNIESIIK